MTFLVGHRVLVLGETAAKGGLARYFSSLGADLVSVTIEDLKKKLSEASFLIEELGLSRLAEHGWPRRRIEQMAPKLIHVSVTVFGSEGPHSQWEGSELIASAMSGVLRLTGTPDRAPVKEALDACGFHADMIAAAGALAAHYERGQSGLGQHVDVSSQEVALSRQLNSVLVWQFERRKMHRVGGALNYGLATVRCIWPLQDGWCFHSLMTGRFGAPANQALSDWIDEAGLPNPLRGADWISYNRSTLDPGIRVKWEEAIDAFFRTRTKEQIATEGRKRGINATVIAEPADVLIDPHLQSRGFWREEAGIRTPARFIDIHDAEPAPRVSADARLDNRAENSLAIRKGPLAGVRVLDFSWALVGSITTKTLGDLGADVVKVESRTRPCLSRIDVHVSASRADNFDDKPWFAHLNSSKRSLSLDLKKPESREVLNPLIRWADVVVENFSPGTMAKLGLDYATLHKMNPNLVMVSGSVYGQTGPFAREWGIDGTGAALSGRTYLTGWPDRDPVIPGAVPYGDVIVPNVMAGAVAGALQYRRETGSGAHIDASMYEICVQQMYDAILRTQQGSIPQRMGNQDLRFFHQGVYPALGEDRWVAISLATEATWDQLCELVALPQANDAAARDTVIAAWTCDKSDTSLVEQLQEAGIAAGVVQDIEDVLETDPQIAARCPLVPIDHPLLGEFGHMRTPMQFSRSKVEMFRAPGIGEHTKSIARDLAGLSESHIEELESLGVFR
jgi:crotonobetainyl-CoA:carnitine CoA-transferase CaiB-like acyl-CoA transferase